MPNQYEVQARTWATSHLVLAMLIAAAAGVILGALLF
jgi:hypothetical protein